ncbi:MAG: ribokinase [Micrococcales bacterium]|nr:ribokinase [Micrococcales bacterium]
MKIAVVGGYGVGLTMRVPQVPVAGQTVIGASFLQGPGGKGSNQAVGAARLGADVSLLTAVGDDAFGHAAFDLWAREGVDARGVVVVPEPTMVGFILVEPNGENRIAIAPGALNRLDTAAVEAFRPCIAAADALLVSMEIPAAAVTTALRIGRQVNTVTILNPAPAGPLPDSAWHNIDIMTPNQSEAAAMLGLGGHHGMADEALATRVRERTGGPVVVTRGGEGVLVADDAGITAVPAVHVAGVVDTTGAGDSLSAALAVALAEGRSLQESVRFAVAAAAHTVTVAGVIPALPTRDQVTRSEVVTMPPT